MKFLHTSDWHIGRTIRMKPRWEEQELALQQVLDHVREQKVDCLLVSGDVFDSSAPSPDAEELLYSFFRELWGLGACAAVIAGNHDHPVRFDALSHILRALRIHLVGEPASPEEGGLLEIASRDAKETALIAALPWVPERRAVAFAQLQESPGAPLAAYAERVAGAMNLLTSGFRPDACNLMLSHVLVNNATIGPGGGERELHMSMGIYGLPLQMMPSAPQYVGLGHVHKAQAVRKSPAAWYSGSLLQLDFGERGQDKSVNLIELRPRQPARVEHLPITAGRAMVDLGSAVQGVALADLPAYAAQYPEHAAWLRVFLDVDTPVANLTATVREILPNAASVERVRLGAGPVAPGSAAGAMGPPQLFDAYYRSSLGRGHEPSAATADLFRRLLEEETSASPQT